MKNPLALPTKILGDSIAAEWNSQDGIIRPHAMHLTGMANSALDKAYFNQRFGTNMVSTLGLEPPAQNAGENLVKFRSYLESLNPFEITAMENAIAMCHSAIVAVAVMDRHVSVEKVQTSSLQHRG
ncbi:hypothetical protein SARC_05037 [Sphaeroforma arctica JP610]|uniref:Uncharacterized protein n=1 Tax=Sphaeroforma arctica JP610 TaxID=667725 RepID=A0A0L0G3B7_9EUKA|nr:hypothetical protein SARC_05037 [Sphaeroforma arctica JP610]KNC82678.1 hypothetical protein SARC_05037 [Sphaeroforma arctica JP610]|eukprot:XP_014156580.1 hypothetical protein SARC_05037 [Sphaeroforma arctica JP610]